MYLAISFKGIGKFFDNVTYVQILSFLLLYEWGQLPACGILARIYATFGENHGKLLTARLTSATENEPGTSCLPAFERSH